MKINLATLTKLVDGEISLREYAAATETELDNRVLDSARVALATLNANRHLINMVLTWLNSPVTFAAAPGDDLQGIEGLAELREVLAACESPGDCHCDD